MVPDPSFGDLMARLRASDEEAAKRVFQQFAQRLIALARSRLDDRLRRKVDPEDILQSVFKSFFCRQAQGEFELDSWESLWSLLSVITVRKCGRWRRYFHAERRNLQAEISSWEVFADEPTPEEAAILTETLEQVMRGLEGSEREMVMLSLQGYTVAEISDQVDRTRRTVQRVLQRVRQRLERLQAQDVQEA
jgi:RNA polymerase sigma-70 factor (ECF subfamily)